MRNAELDEAQAGIKIVGRNTNNLRYADDTTLMENSERDGNTRPPNLPLKKSVCRSGSYS